MEKLKTPPEEQVLIEERALAELRDVLNWGAGEGSAVAPKTTLAGPPLFFARFQEKIQLGMN